MVPDFFNQFVIKYPATAPPQGKRMNTDQEKIVSQVLVFDFP